MSWENADAGKLIDAAFKGLTITCPEPSCKGAIADVQFNHLMSGNFHLSIRCPRCDGSRHFQREDDPLREKYRDWTEGEIQTLVDKQFRHEFLTCPVDGTPLQNDSAGRWIKAICPRCRKRVDKQMR